MSKISVEKLYANYEILTDAKSKIGEHVKEYEEIIAGVKGGDKEKKLAPQFIAKFFKYFPTLQYQAMEALFDICEDDDMSIRKSAIKVLPMLCKDTKDNTQKVADILAQLLQLEDTQEHAIVTNSLIEIIKIDPLPALKAIFKHIYQAELSIRSKCIKFISTKIQTIDSDVISKEVEDYIVTEIRKIVLTSQVGEEITELLRYLKSSKYSQTPAGQQEIAKIVMELADLNADFDPLDTENDNVDKLIFCIDFILPLTSKSSQSTEAVKFLEYMCDKVLPKLNIISNMGRAEYFEIKILRQLADLSSYCGQLANPIKQVQIIYDILITFLPLPPEDNDGSVFPLQDYSSVENLMYAFHKLARQCPDFLTSNPTLLKDFRTRLQYFSRGVQGCIKTIKDSGDIKKEDKKKRDAYNITTNINTLIKDLFYSPPSYKSVIILSWKSEEVEKKSADTKSTPNKRHAPITIDFDRNASNPKQLRKSTDNVKIYTPPSGKFSNSFQNQSRKLIRGRGRGLGRGRGRGRGRGSWRN